MSSMPHHNLFRRREFATFLRSRRTHPARPRPSPTILPSTPTSPPHALPLPPLPSPLSIPPLHPVPHLLSSPFTAEHPLSTPRCDSSLANGNLASFPKSNAVASARKRKRDSTDPILDLSARRKEQRLCLQPVTSPTAIANVVTPRSTSLPGFEQPGPNPAIRLNFTTPVQMQGSELRTSFRAASCSEVSAMRSQEPRTSTDEPSDSQLAPGFDCDLCDNRFLRKHHLERHIQNIHEGQRPWTCDVCGFAFHQKPNLERHIMTVHEEQRPFRCNVCEMSFGRKGVLKKHVQMVHEHSRKFECDICKISFGLKSDLKRHVQSVHQKKRPFVCEVCSASFSRRSDLKRHTISLHPGATIPSRRNSGPSARGSS